MDKADRSFLKGVIEGFYGRPWSQRQRLKLHVVMQELELNTYLYCPKDDLKHRVLWRECYTGDELQRLRTLIESCRSHDIEFLYGIAPGLTICYSDDSEMELLRARFRQCRVLVMESNHATDLLQVGPYARSTKARISGARGHLSNESLALFVREDLGRSVRCLVLAHLSRVNNVPEIAEMTCREALAARGRHDVRVVVSRQDRVAESVDLGGPGPAGRQVALPF